MVKGNAERRKQLSQIRRDEEQADRERRRANDPLRATPAEVRGRLLNDSKRTPPPYPEDAKGLTGWVTLTSSGGGSGGGGGDKGKGNDRRERRKVNGKRGNSRQDPESTSGSVDKMICEHFLRTGYCEARRCRHIHGAVLTHLSNVPPPTTDAPEGVLPVVPKPLRKCEVGGKEVYEPALRRQIAQPNLLRFVEWGGELVFDCENPEVYAAYCGRVNALQARVVRSRSQPWSVKHHGEFSPGFRVAIWTTLVSAARFAQDVDRVGGPAPAQPTTGQGTIAVPADADADAVGFHDEQPSSRVPPEVWAMVFGFLVRGDWAIIDVHTRTRTTSRNRTTSGSDRESAPPKAAAS